MIGLDAASYIILGLATGLVTALVTVRLALRRFRSERMWEKKVQTYSDIFDALFHLKNHAEVQLKHFEEGVQFDVKYLKDVGDRATVSYNAIRKAALIGTFILSNEAAARLSALVVSFDHPNLDGDIVEELSADLQAVDGTVADLRPIAKKDLQQS